MSRKDPTNAPSSQRFLRSWQGVVFSMDRGSEKEIENSSLAMLQAFRTARSVPGKAGPSSISLLQAARSSYGSLMSMPSPARSMGRFFRKLGAGSAS